MLEEWNLSCDILSQLLQKKITMASIPGGDTNLLSQITASEAGIKYLFTSEPTYKPWALNGLTYLGSFFLNRDAPLRKVEDFDDLRGFHYQMLKRRIKQTGKKIHFPY